jgi:hypothetical protein
MQPVVAWRAARENNATLVETVFESTVELAAYQGHEIISKPIAPLTALVHAQGAQEVALAKSGPVHIDEAELGVRQLPQEKIGHPLFA